MRRVQRVMFVLVGLSTLLVSPRGAFAADDGHAAWDRLVKRHVQEGRVAYGGMAEDHRALEAYLDSLAGVDPSALPSQEARLAFWLNAYNACVVREVLEHMPVQSVKDVPGFFTTPSCQLDGRALSVNEVEARANGLGDFRSHFGLVCASRGCPPLPPYAFTADRLDLQLDALTRAYVRDPEHGLRVEDTQGTVWLSKVFDWGRADFGQPRGPLGLLNPPLSVPKLVETLERFLPEDVAAALRARAWRVRFIPYDWRLNDTERAGG